MLIMTGDYSLWDLGVRMLMGALGCFRAQRAERTASRGLLPKQRFSRGLVLALAMVALMGILGAHNTVSS
jgi:hypothetical protein